MTPHAIRRPLHRRLAFLEAELERRMLPDRLRAIFVEEHEALGELLRRSGLYEPERLAKNKAIVHAQVLPLMDRRRERDRSARDVAAKAPASADKLEAFVDRVTQAVRVA